MAVSLYTSRVILRTLGVEDYGIYNVVGGVVAMFSFINATMSSATSRFLTYELGRGDQEKLKDTFSAAFWVHVIIAVLIFILCESIGLWFLKEKMVIPTDRMFAANVVFQLSILSTMFSITQVPYNATLISHEKLDIYAYVELINVFLKLGILYLLIIIPFDKLILYGILTLFINVGVMMFYRYYGSKHYQECRVQFKWQPEIVKPMLSFSGWDLYGNLSVTARTQGVSMLLNVFFGPVLNAAAGIATSVQSAVMSFASNVTTAVRPQIIKSCANKDYQRMISLINNSCRINFMILSLLIVPLCAEINYILKIWLVSVPDYAPIFCVLTLCFNLFANLSHVVVTGLHAYGKIIRPSLINGTLYLLVIPITYLSFRHGGSPWTAYLFNLCAVFLGMLSNVFSLNLYIPEYSISVFIKDVLLRCLLLITVGWLGTKVVTSLMESSFLRLIITTLVSSLIMGVVGWFFILSHSMKEMIKDKILFIVSTKK